MLALLAYRASRTFLLTRRALTADRVYREAWAPRRALTLLDEETGTAFDAICVAALHAVVALELDDSGWRADLQAIVEPLRPRDQRTV